MKRAAVWRGARATWWACTVPADLYEPNDPMPMRAPICDSHEHEDFPSHAEALAHALAAVGLVPDPDPSRCPMRATDPITTRHPREDGWRCGYEVGHVHGHGLFTSDGEDTLYAGVWVHPADLSPTNPEPTEAP